MRLHLLCPIRALAEYLQRTRDIRPTDQLFVVFGGGSLGKTLTKSSLAHWLTDVISKAYEGAGVPPPTVKAHSERCLYFYGAKQGG